MWLTRINVVLFISLLGMGIVANQGASAKKAEDAAENGDATTAEGIPYAALRNFTEVFARIKNHYVETVDDTTLLENAIRGMLQGLDPHSAYLDDDAFDELQENTSGQFGGLGIEVTMEDGFIKIVSPIDDTPAQRAGLEPGDLIIRLDQKPVKGMSLTEAVQMMRGEPGSQIELTIVRESDNAPFQVVLERDLIQVRSVRSELLDQAFGYVRISNFQVKTGHDLLETIEQLKQDSNNDLRGLILDLRNNPGGVLSAAVDVADAFLDEGLVVYTEGRSEDAELSYSASPGDVLDGVPLVVLVNSGSASASEIVAGAIQDHVRGILMGEPTFGKGSVQSVLPLNDGTAVKLTTARYFTPKGRSIQAEGIEPDIKLARARVEILANDNELAPIKEADLNKHLDNQDSLTDTNTDQKSNESPKPSLAGRDYALFEALNLLKAMSILQAPQS